MQDRSASALYPRADLYFALALLTAIIGFYPSYFGRLTQTDVAHHFHGLTATAWMLLLITQGWLFRQRRWTLHRRLGRGSLLLAPLFLVSGLLMIHAMLRSANGFSQTFGARLAFVDMTTLAYFALAYGLAIRWRKNRPIHARLMASTAVLVLPPALARVLAGLVPGITSFASAFNWSYIITELIVLALIIHDVRSDRWRAPYPALLALLFVQHLSFGVTPTVTGWSRLCAWVGTI